MVKNCYIHIPFCSKICSYCDFCKLYYDEKFVDKYLNELEKEIKTTYKGEVLDTIYIGGGNTFRLLSELKKYNILNNLRNYDGIIFGGSAGAIIFGKDINHCELEECNIIGLKDTTGLNYLQDYAILCHLNNKNLEKNKDYLEKYSRKNKLIYLPEEDVMLLTENEIIMFGEKDYIICKEGKIECHKPKDLKKIVK